MISKVKKLFFLSVFLMMPFFAKAELITYNPPSIVDIPVNNLYTVAVREQGDTDWVDLREYDALVNTEQDWQISPTHMSFVSFDADFAKNIEVRVTKNQGSVGSVRIRPDSVGITPQVSGNIITFTMTAAKKISVEVDGDIQHNLFIFANKKESSLVSAMQGKNIKYMEPGSHNMTEINNDGDNNFYYFKPGVHYIVDDDGLGAAPDNGGIGTGYISLRNSEHMHIAGGAYVYGAVTMLLKDNVNITGRGVLSGGKFNHSDEPKHQAIIVDKSSNVHIRDITILDADGWNINFYLSNRLSAQNIKIISHMWGTDGINPLKSSEVYIEDCFIRNNDDAISPKLAPFNLSNEYDKILNLKTSNVMVENSTLWADRGRAIGFGPAGYNTTNSANRIIEDVTFRNIDILRAQAHLFDEQSYPYPQWSNGVLSIVSNDDSIIRNIVFDNIRIDALDNDHSSLINLWMNKTTYGESDGKSIANIYFNDISLEGAQQRDNVIQSLDGTHFASGVHFSNLKIGSSCINNSSAGAIDISSFAQNVTFACNAVLLDTYIDTHPDVQSDSSLATFNFSANEAATFKCKLDEGLFEACSSPKSYNGLLQGNHTFSIKAMNDIYHEDPTPATYSWTISALADAVPPGVPTGLTVF